MTPIEQAIEHAWDKFCEGFDLHSSEWLDKGANEMFEAGYLTALQTQPEPTCNPHPDAPHGFNRNASHSLDRYVCDCEGWVPDEYKLGYNQALKDVLEVVLDNISSNGGTVQLEAHCRQDIQDLHKH